jgi:hypothetical protein
MQLALLCMDLTVTKRTHISNPEPTPAVTHEDFNLSKYFEIQQ